MEELIESENIEIKNPVALAELIKMVSSTEEQ
jgi:hypothetical protein